MDNSNNNKFPLVTEGRIGADLVQTVDARELHAFLEVGKDFSNWIKDRIDQYEFVENVDFVVFAEIGENRKGGRPSKEYAITLDMGKELGMVERTPKGKEVRQYFIECERRAHSPAPFKVPTTAEAFASAFQMIADSQKTQAAMAAEIRVIAEQSERTTEKVDVLAQAMMIHDKIPPNGELVTYLRKRVSKAFGVSSEIINKVLDVYSVHPKFAVRNQHENADGGVNYGYWIREVNAVFRQFVDESVQITPAMCEHPRIEGRFRLVKSVPVARKPRVTVNGKEMR